MKQSLSFQILSIL